MLFNLLCAPCFAAMGAIKTEMNSAKWTWGAIGYMTVFAYAVSLIANQLGLWIGGNGFTAGTAVGLIVLAVLLFFLLRKNPYESKNKLAKGVVETC
jgi:ferrous iron transport protein B